MMDGDSGPELLHVDFGYISSDLKCIVEERKTLLVSKLGCVLSQDFVAFCLEYFLCFVSRPLRFVSRMGYVLSQDLLRFVLRLDCILFQDCCVVSRILAFCLHLKTLSAFWNQATIQDGRVVVQNVQGRQNRGQGMNPRGGVAARYGGGQNRVGNVNPGQARSVKCYNCNGGQDNAFDDDVDEQPVQDLVLNVDNVFQADDCDAFDSDMDEAPTAQTMFMANLSSADPVTVEARPSYDSDILYKVQDHDHYQDAVCAHHEEHAMHDSVQLDDVVDSYADYTSDSNMILYVKDNEVPVVHSNVSSVPKDAFMMIYNDMCEPPA
uniref:Retrovirus-related Pol polyprotein from transposon TNT 1-94 n=1 Tax=Tanacetum cinerariifolium TaxID=118510 RepID=A0A699HHU2_TANCI|nr:hypothetical protein [Tanacetum cinerariifolium]